MGELLANFPTNCSSDMNDTTIQIALQSILERYVQARLRETFGKHPLRTNFENVKKVLVSSNPVSSRPDLSVRWSMGQGNWAKVPWIALLDSRETLTTQNGVYCVYLFRQDMSGVYLTFNQGVTKLIEETGKQSAYSSLRANAQKIHPLCTHLVEKGFTLSDGIDLKADPGLGTDYEASTIAYKLYDNGRIPDDTSLLQDLEAVLSVYNDYVQNSSHKPSLLTTENTNLPDIIQEFILSATDKGSQLRTGNFMATRFIASAESKRFLVLTGLAGSGKTKLAQAFAQWITPKPESDSTNNPHYTLIPVGADWTGNENVLGYPNGLDDAKYVSKPALDLILHAQAHPSIPHFLILDEMNLSHVERYFADFLSALESEEEIPLHNGPERKSNGQLIPQSIALPKNLFVIGTVNVDETTYMFSPKVLDRANVIEFRMDATELEAFLSNPAKPDLSRLNGKGAAYGQAFVEAAKGSASIPNEARSAFEVEMLLYFNVLQEHGAEFGYRVAHEAARFIHFYKLLGNYPDDDIAWFASAFDCVVVQKFLPKLHGSRAKLGPLLKALWFLSTQTRPYSEDEKANKLIEEQASKEAAEKSKDTNFIPTITASAIAPHPLSANKIARMWKLLDENGFASFAEA